jgi:hypothetical protein
VQSEAAPFLLDQARALRLLRLLLLLRLLQLGVLRKSLLVLRNEKASPT